MLLSREKREQALELLKYFKIAGRPANEAVTDGQLEIFCAIIYRVSPRIHIESCTQYGKSLMVAFATIILSCIDGELVTVAAPTEEKSRIIMRYYIEHIGDSPIFHTLLNKETPLERLQMEVTKDRIVLQNGGGIFLISVQAGNSKKGFQAAMGEGSKIVIEDESCLIPDDIEATAIRMVAGKPDAMYVKIGNPFYRQPPYTHFFKSSRDPRYYHIHIDYHQALAEGRYMPSFIDEVRGKPLFSVLYECIFPEIAEMDDDGYFQLLTEMTVVNAYLKDETPLELTGDLRMGIDLAGGGRNYSTIVIRGNALAKLVFKNRTPDPLVVIGKAEELAEKYGVPFDDDHIFPDKTGSIAWCTRLNELHPYHPRRTQEGVVVGGGKQNDFGIVVGRPPEEDPDQSHKQYLNLRAQMNFRARDWILAGGKLQGKPHFDEAMNIRYKVQSDKKFRMKSKEDMHKDGVESPDVWDALCLTFAKRRQVIHKRIKQSEVQQDRFGLY